MNPGSGRPRLRRSVPSRSSRRTSQHQGCRVSTRPQPRNSFIMSFLDFNDQSPRQFRDRVSGSARPQHSASPPAPLQNSFSMMLPGPFPPLQPPPYAGRVAPRLPRTTRRSMSFRPSRIHPSLNIEGGRRSYVRKVSQVSRRENCGGVLGSWVQPSERNVKRMLHLIVPLLLPPRSLPNHSHGLVPPNQCHPSSSVPLPSQLAGWVSARATSAHACQWVCIQTCHLRRLMGRSRIVSQDASSGVVSQLRVRD